MLIRFCFILLLSIQLAVAGDTDLTAVQVLNNMKQAMTNLSYQGTVVFSKNGKIEPMKYFHAVNNSGVQEYLTSINAPLREIIRYQDTVIFQIKEPPQVEVKHRDYEHSFLADLPDDLNSLTSIYQFDIVGKDTIAQLPAYVITMQPKDDFRYVRKIWIDAEHFLPLKVTVYNFSAETVKDVMFTDIEIKASIPFKDVSGIIASTITTDTVKSFSHASFAVSNLPSGYREAFFSVGLLHKEPKLVEHLLLTDGFASVSVYAETIDSTIDSSLTGLHSIGSFYSFGKILNNRLIMVVGEVPAKAVQKIAEGITLQTPKQ